MSDQLIWSYANVYSRKSVNDGPSRSCEAKYLTSGSLLNYLWKRFLKIFSLIKPQISLVFKTHGKWTHKIKLITALYIPCICDLGSRTSSLLKILLFPSKTLPWLLSTRIVKNVKILQKADEILPIWRSVILKSIDWNRLTLFKIPFPWNNPSMVKPSDSEVQRCYITFITEPSKSSRTWNDCKKG